MESCVYFKFKSQKEPTRVHFDGGGISVFELKREIILKSGLGSGTDFDLAIFNEDESEEYDDDTTIVPRTTTVIARRTPAMKPGAGRAARYVMGKMPVHAKNHSRREQAKAVAAKPKSDVFEQINNASTEEEKLAAVFKAQGDVWTTNEEELARSSSAQARSALASKKAVVPDHEPPAGYICYRCGEKGHWIQVCPTNDNPDFDGRHRVKRTTGIPRSFLKTIDKATALGQSTTSEEAKPPTKCMVNADGDYVVATPDTAAWQKFQEKTKTTGVDGVTPSIEVLQEHGLICELNDAMFTEPVKTPCCGKTYCNECISNALMDSDFVCPSCHKDGVLLDDLVPDQETTQKIQQYLREKDAKRSSTPESTTSESATDDTKNSTKSDTTASTVTADAKSRSVTPASHGAGPSKLAASSSTDGAARKRRAEDSLESAPKAVKTAVKPSPSGQVIQSKPSAGTSVAQKTPVPANQNMNAGVDFAGMANMMMPGMDMYSMGAMNGMNMDALTSMMPMMGLGMGCMPGMPDMSIMCGVNGGMGGMNGFNGVNPYMMAMGNAPSMCANDGGNYSYQGSQQWYPNNYAHSNVYNQPQQSGDDAYMRKPVNPHRHQNRLRRVRPTDYREL